MTIFMKRCYLQGLQETCIYRTAWSGGNALVLCSGILAGSLAVLCEIFRVSPEFSQENNGTVSRVSHDHFLSHPFQFIDHPVLYKLDIGKTSAIKLNSVAFSPQANYTDRATAASRRS
jgi:hypothetical protein